MGHLFSGERCVLRAVRRRIARATALLVMLFVFNAEAIAGEDWPQFLGPMRDATYRGEAKLADAWPAAGPAVVWKMKTGSGFGAPAIADGKLVIFHQVGRAMTLDCADAATGKPLWSVSYDSRDKGDGPGATPAVADGRVVTFGPDGVLWCVELATGKTLWQIDTAKLYATPAGFFGRACSPLIEGDLVLLSIGGPEHGIGAFDVKTGALKWKATGDEAGYASPVAATIAGKRFAFFFTRAGLVATDPQQGHVLFQHPWRSKQHASVNAASPVIVDDLIFLSASYQTGATVLQLQGDQVRTLWAADEVLSSQYSNIVHHQGHLFGFDGRNDFNDTRLRCIELKTGKVKWTAPNLPSGPLLLADDKIIALLESGEVQLIEASTQGYKKLADVKLLESPVRANPALANGLLYLRDKRQVLCVDLNAR